MKYVIQNVKSTAIVKGIEVEFDELIPVDENGNRIFVRDVEIKNDIVLYDAYKEKLDLLTSSKIKSIREQYHLNQKEFSLLLGMGEITIHRYENGTIQTDSSDALIRSASDFNIMKELFEKNKGKIDEVRVIEIEKEFEQVEKLLDHKIISFDISQAKMKPFQTLPVQVVSNLLIEYFNSKSDEQDLEGKITNLVLNKLLYYVQGVALTIYDTIAFFEPIVAWKYGPVIEEVYHTYKLKDVQPIWNHKDIEITSGMRDIVQMVVDGYGKFSAFKLTDLTHEEVPWSQTPQSEVINQELLKAYFDQIYAY